MNANSLLKIAGARIWNLANFSDKEVTTLYRAAEKSPPPLWLIDAIDRWYEANKPISPQVLDTAFRTEFAKVAQDALPKLAILGGLSKKPSETPPDNDPVGGKGGKRNRRTRQQEDGGDNKCPQGNTNATAAALLNSSKNEPASQFAPDSFEAATDCYREVANSKPVNRAAMRSLLEHVQGQPWAAGKDGQPLTIPALQKRIARKAGVQLRERSKDTGAQRKRQAIIEVLRGPIAQRRRESHDKGAGEYAMGSLTAIIKGTLRDPSIQAALNEHPDIRGEMPSLTNVVRLLSEYRGGVDNRADVRDHLEKTIGFRAAWAGQVAVVDATGWPVRFRYGDNRENHKRWLYLLCDVASGHLMAANRSATSESEGWRPKDDLERNDVMLGFLRDLGFAPEWLVNDAVSTLTDGLRFLKPGIHPAEKISAGVLLWLAAGVRPYVRMGARPTGGAHVERAVHTTKDKLAELGTKRAIEKEAKGCGLQRLNQCDNELEFLNQISTAIHEINATQLKRRGCPLSRNELRANDAAILAREARMIAPDLFRANDDAPPKWWQITSSCKTGQIMAGRVAVRINGKAWTAELEEPENGWECKPEEKYALVLPPGARHNDDPEAFRIIVIETEGSRIQYHPATARSVKLDAYYQDISQPLIGSFRKKPETTADQFARLRDNDAAAYRQSVKEGTTDTPITQDDFESRFR